MRRIVAGASLAVALVAALSTMPALAQSADPAAVPVADAAGTWDPFEPINRSVHSFNVAFGSTVAVKLADAYEAAVPGAVRTGIDNFFTNLREPLTAVASLLQGDYGNAGVSASRFAVNSTAGIAGIFDVASRMDLVSRPTDLGVALCRYNVPAGPYLVLPFIGPSNLRDAAAVVATYAGAFWMLEDWAPAYIVADRSVAFSADRPAVSDSDPAADFYAAQREQYLARRAALCSDSLPTASLKASPLGDIVEAAPRS